MKKLIFLLFVFVIQANLHAWRYFPEGTKWTEIRLDTLKYNSWHSKVGDEWVPNYETIEYRVQGEYIDERFNDKYSCIFTNGPEWADSLTLLIYGGRNQDADWFGGIAVAAFDDDGQLSWPCHGQMYPLSWEVGTIMRSLSINMAGITGFSDWIKWNVYGTVEEIKEGDFGGVRPLKYSDVNGIRFIQGIGVASWNDGECIFGPIRPYEVLPHLGAVEDEERHYRSMLVHFERDGEVLYDVWPEINEPVTYTAGQMATIIMPTAPDAGKGKYYRLDRCEGNEIIFEQELQPRAHVPYIIVPFEDFSIDPGTLDLAGLKPDTVSVGSISFIGTYVRTELPALTGGDGEWRPFPPSLGGDGGGFYRIIDTTPDCSPLPGEGQGERLAFVGTLRAYLTWDDPYGPGATKGPEEEMKIVLHDRGTGSLSPAPSPEGEGRKDAAIYDLSGKMVNGKWLNGKSPHGIYIKDRKKWVKPFK